MSESSAPNSRTPIDLPKSESTNETGPPPSSADRRLPRQLSLNLDPATDSSHLGLRVARQDQVFINRDLDLGGIDWVGFDMDYTLAIYQQKALDDLSVHVTVERMVSKGYPKFLRQLQYDIEFPIRGLLVDKRHGNVLKMDRFKVVHKAYHGLQRLSQDDIRRLYHDTKVHPHTSRYHWIDTLFSLSEVTSFSAIVEALEKHELQVNYAKIFQDVRESIDEAHRDGQFHSTVANSLKTYLHNDPQLGMTLHRYRCAGKRLFLLTNSPWKYTNSLMTHLLGTESSEYSSWRGYFDIVITNAQKPSWFREGRPILERKGDVLVDVPGELKPGRIYEGGNLQDFERRMGIRGPRVLYVGDHIFGDILRSKKESVWRTAMILPEMGAELAAHSNCAQHFQRVEEIEISRDRLDDELRFQQLRFRQLSKDSDKESAAETKLSIENHQTELQRLRTEHSQSRQAIDTTFHPYWGSLLKEAGERSSFGAQIATYADIYMRRVSSLGHYSPHQHFLSRRDVMPHEQ